MTIHGIDVSVWQGEMDWKKAQANNSFAIIRAGSIDGNTGVCYRDSQLVRNMQQAPEYMLAIGYYFYFRPKFDAKLQADYFSSLIEAAPGTIYPVMDIEEKGNSTRQANDAAWIFCNQVEVNLGRVCMIYTNPNYWQYSIYHDPNRNWAYLHPLWIANWKTSNPIIPNDWSSKGQTYKFWQYDVLPDGPANGAQSTKIDHDVYPGTLEQFLAEFGGVTPPPPGCPKIIGVEADIELTYDNGATAKYHTTDWGLP